MALRLPRQGEALNDLHNTEVKPNPQWMCGKSLAYVDQIRSHLFKQKPDKRCVSSPSPVKWTPPPPGFVMLNSDASIFKDLGGMGVGVVGPDHLGACLVACRQFYSMLPEPEFAEAMALRQATSLARKKGLGQVIFSSDCLSLVQCLHSEARDRSPVGVLMEEIKFVVKDLTSTSFIHVKRKLNKAAHLLAKSCNCLKSSEVFNSATDCIRRTLCIDVLYDQ
jgi:hypothetical protein